jgi:DNA polymerase
VFEVFCRQLPAGRRYGVVAGTGRLLERMLKAIGLDRTTVYLSNLVPWRPPTGRKLYPQESAVCLPFVWRQIELTQPAILVCLGDDAAQSLMGLKGSVIRTRGVWQELRPAGGVSMRAIATLTPSYLLRATGAKRTVWRDLLEVRKALDQIG